MAFKGRDPVRTKIVIDNKIIEQVNWNTQSSVRRFEPSMPLLLILALSVDGITCLIPFES